MKTRPIVPARIEWADDGTPHAPTFGDAYHGHAGAWAQAQRVFLAGNGLPQRWRGRSDFTIAETGFGLGNNFLATWQAWRDDTQRPTRLHYVALDAHPPLQHDLQRAHAGHQRPELVAQLLAAWPPLVPGLHRIHFEGGALQLLLALGDVRDLLPELVFAADAFYLDGFAPALNPAMWERRVIKALARRARPDATAATWSVAREVRDGLSAAGFEFQRAPGLAGKREVLRARFAPRFAAHSAAFTGSSPDLGEHRAVVIGAGLAGACTAAALAAQGFEVQVLDREARPAGGSSGNPAGLFHATLHADDSPYARLFRAAALRTARLIGGIDANTVPHGLNGLLRLEQALSLDGMQALITVQGLPADFVQALAAAAASQLAGVALAAPAWFYPAGGWVDPAALVHNRLAQPGVQFVGNTAVHALRLEGTQWLCLDASGRCIAAAPQLVLACAEQVNPLLASVGWPAFPLGRTRGQVSHFELDASTDASTSRLRLPVAGDGYALPLPGGGLLCGATRSDDNDAALRHADHQANFERLQRLCGLVPPADPNRWAGRVGWRVQPVDRLPIAGPLAAAQLAPALRLDQARLVPRAPGLHLACALGARGITLAPLLGEVVAARIAGTPVPLEQGLIDLIDPARWIVRAARHRSG